MNTNTKYAILLISSLSSLLLAVDKEPKQRQKQPMSMHEYFDRMFEEMQQSMQHMREAFAHDINNLDGKTQNSIDVSLQEKENSAFLIVRGLDTDSVDATVSDDENNLLLKTNLGNINLTIEDKYVQIYMQHQQESSYAEASEDKPEDKNQDKMEKVVTSVSHQSYTMSLRQPLDLNAETLKINYDKESKTLSVEIPFVVAPEKRRKAVPVNFKTAQMTDRK